MFKKALSIMFVIAIMMTAASCGKNKEYTLSSEIAEPEKKVVIMVSPQTQYKEDFFAAEALEREYPKSVIVQYCNDSRELKAGNPDIMDYSVKYAKDNSVGAIIYARATQFTEIAIDAAKAENPDLVTVVVEPEGNTDSLTGKADLMFSADWKKCAEDMVSTAKEMGAEYFVMFSFDRHLKNDNYRRLKSNLDAQCKENNIEFVYENSFDPNNAGGVEKAEQCIQESVSRLELNKKISNRNAVLFSTDSTIQKVLASMAIHLGYMYICPTFPSAYSGICELFNQVDAAKCENTDQFIKDIETSLKDQEPKGKLAIYTNTLATCLIKAALYSTFDVLTNGIDSETIGNVISSRICDAAENKEMEVYCEETFGNLYEVYIPGFKILN